MKRDPQAFAEAWIAGWNSHDLNLILSHYAEDIVFTSAVSTQFTGDPTGRVVGKPALRDYWGRALEAYTDLHFALRGVYAGPDSVAIRYFSNRTDAEVVEVVRFGADGLVRESAAYYE